MAYENKEMKWERLAIAKPDIMAFFENHSKKVFRKNELADIQGQQWQFWRLARTTSTSQFIDFLLEETPLGRERLVFRHRAEILYRWGTVPTLELLQHVKSDSYFSHFTAMYLNELTEQIPKTIYLNCEQPEKHSPNQSLQQDRINYAFKGKARISKNVASYKDQTICLLNGMQTGKLGVTELYTPQHGRVHVTNIERTLIDIAVRPAYSGGVFEVLKSYKLARDKVSINKLTAMLKNLNYTYPYHQAIGFYIEKAGVYKKSQIELLRQMEMKFDFYLAHGMKETEYSPEWRLFFPKGF